MRSAIAARKAARQSELVPHGNEAQPARSVEPSILSSDSDDSQSVIVTSGSEVTPPRKRKGRSPDAPRRTGHKRKRLTNADIGRTRYFEAHQPIEGFDDGNEDNLPPESLSRQDSDTSEEENCEIGQEISWNQDQELNSEKSWTPESRSFSPILDSNTFRLSGDDLKSMGCFAADVLCGTLILLPPEHPLTFVGTAYITLLQGSVSILGTSLYPSLHSHRVFAPRSSPLVSIEAFDISSAGRCSHSLLYPNDPNGRILPLRVQNAIKASDSAVFIHPLHTGIEGLGMVCRTFDGVFTVGPDMEEGHADDDIIGVEGFHPVRPLSRPHQQLQPFFMPESWEDALNTTIPPFSQPEEFASRTKTNPLVALVRGPKKCGKSTFARTLLNRLTTRYRHVAYLDCDLGQSEFTPGGMVSLHVLTKPVFGPPFTHPKLPHRAHYVGHSTPRSSPSHYISCIQALIQTYRMDVQYAYQETLANNHLLVGEDALASASTEDDDRLDNFVPLVVNTHGWDKGLGGDLLRKIEETVEATDIFDLDPQTSMLPGRVTPASSGRLHAIQPILGSSLGAYYTPADHRSLSILSYFHCRFPTRVEEDATWSTDLPLCARLPWEVSCREAIDRIILVGAGFEDVVSSELDKAINCGIVGLVCDEDSLTDPPPPEAENTDSLWPYTQGSSAPSPSTSHCVGLAVIRGVDARTHTLHLLTPVSPSLFSTCRVLVKGELELPIWGMLDLGQETFEGVSGIKWEDVPYLQMGGGRPNVIGAARRKVRKNLMRKGQMLLSAPG